MSGRWSTMHTILLLIVLFMCIPESDQKPTIKEIKALSSKLMENYSKHILPTESEDPFNVTIYVRLQAVGNIDEIEEKLSTVIWFHYMWTDESIRWNREETNISFITLGWNEVWKPVLQLTNPQTDSGDKQYCDRSYDSVIYRYDGKCYYDELMTTRTSCDMDMSFYPFDVQTCNIHMKLIGSTKFEFNLHVSVHEGFSTDDAQHGSWTLNNVNISSNTYGEFVIILTFERRPLFMLLNIILPLLILALLTPAVFILRKKSGERVSYAVAILLAISVYMTIVSEHLPHNSKPPPLMPIMIFIWYVFDAFVVLIVIINTQIYLTGKHKRIPAIYRHFVLFHRKLSCLKTQKVSSEERQACIAMTMVNGKEDFETNEGTVSEPSELEVTWQELSHAIDKWFFAISYLLKIALPVICLVVMKTKS